MHSLTALQCKMLREQARQRTRGLRWHILKNHFSNTHKMHCKKLLRRQLLCIANSAALWNEGANVSRGRTTKLTLLPSLAKRKCKHAVLSPCWLSNITHHGP